MTSCTNKIILVVAFVLLIYSVEYSLAILQKGQWMWIDGSTAINAKTKINVNKGNKQFPGGRYGTTAWTDHGGNVWMYGGESKQKLDELWFFNPRTVTWYFIGSANDNKTWPVSCVDCASCSYGNLAVLYGGLVKRKGKSNFNTWILNMTTKQWSIVQKSSIPPREKSTYWCDRAKGLLWVYGGVYKSKDLSDMWQFSFNTMEWTEIHNASKSNSPKERFGAVSWIKHETDQLYLFGGQIPPKDLLSDLWVFNTTQRQWTVLSGKDEKHNQPGVYIHKGVPSNASHPGCRSEACSWSRGEALWLYGGKGCDSKTSNSSSKGMLSDIWMYNTSSNWWTWIGGSSKISEKPFYGKKKQPSLKNSPGSRGGSLTFRQGNNLWLFGGMGLDASGKEGYFNDMWMFTDLNDQLGPPSNSGGLPGDTLDMPYTQRLMIAFGILSVAMIVSLLACYRKECNIMYWRYKKRSPKVKYEPLKVKMQVPEV